MFDGTDSVESVERLLNGLQLRLITRQGLLHVTGEAGGCWVDCWRQLVRKLVGKWDRRHVLEYF